MGDQAQADAQHQHHKLQGIGGEEAQGAKHAFPLYRFCTVPILAVGQVLNVQQKPQAVHRKPPLNIQG
ncbi:hypothetical protein GCM10008938_01910 [Deinococcus roseus]|uniref:Uncharacterized protein n=1 Tax=Deinococcus roseus TaxID=392414 RepID=A0ABQ2CUR3_9DEIO|nr:hypothetical protein GCM10008938_01910 [Deinococcus roseus]